MEDLYQAKAEIGRRVHRESNIRMTTAAFHLEWGNYGGVNMVLVMIDPKDIEGADLHILALTAGGDKLNSPVTHSMCSPRQGCFNQC